MGVGGYSKGQAATPLNAANCLHPVGFYGGHQYKAGADVRALMPTYRYLPYSEEVSFDRLTGNEGRLGHQSSAPTSPGVLLHL